MQSVAPRGLSTRPTPIGLRLAAGLGAGRLERPVEQLVEEVEGLPELERALFEPGLNVAGGPRPGTAALEPVVGEPAARFARVLDEPARAGRRADRPERTRVLEA